MCTLPRFQQFARLFALVTLFGLVACGAPPKQVAEEKLDATFYPAPPGAPRLQWLASFTGEKDFAAAQSDFSKFIAGEDKPQSLVTIYGVGSDDGKIFALDSKAATLATFDLKQQRFSTTNGTGAGKLKLPINITIDSDGTKFITDTGRNQVLRYDRDNRYLGAFGEPDQFKPIDVAIRGDRLYVVDIQHHEVQVLNKRDGKTLFKFGKPGSGVGDLFHPTNIAIGPEGDIYVVETSNFRVQRFTPDGKPVRVYGELGDASGTFARPKGIAIDRNGIMYVADAAFQNVQIFDTKDGKHLLAFGQPEKGEGMSLPAAVKIDYDNVAYFKRYADPKFTIEYLVMVTSQIAPNKIDIFGYGKMAGADYSREAAPR